ncbi:MAG TPA: zf-TFIIB domain-containing protein [Flavipsychrobacter sp.]|nr:zf-TFIIB domain-containing protein [Flavipsychrobacter sp.]
MKCPNCNETLLMSQRNNVEIDYCPSCRGVWLDKGELDKILEYAENKYSLAKLQPERDNTYHQDERRYDDDYKKHDDYNRKHRKKKSFLGDFFDFD